MEPTTIKATIKTEEEQLQIEQFRRCMEGDIHSLINLIGKPATMALIEAMLRTP